LEICPPCPASANQRKDGITPPIRWLHPRNLLRRRSDYMDLDAPYEMARRFLAAHYSLAGVTTLRWWQGGWYEWTGTHYAEKENDALTAELYEFIDKAWTGKREANSKHVGELAKAIKARDAHGRD
jgi:hypothetical protein